MNPDLPGITESLFPLPSLQFPEGKDLRKTRSRLQPLSERTERESSGLFTEHMAKNSHEGGMKNNYAICFTGEGGGA